MKKLRKYALRRWWMWVMIILLSLFGGGDRAKADLVKGEQYHVVMVYPENEELEMRYSLRGVYRDASRNGVPLGMRSPFHLYAAPVTTIDYEPSRPYWKPENRLYCVEGTGSPRFIIDLLQGRETAIYSAHDGVIAAVSKLFGTTEEEWALSAHALAYNGYAGLPTGLNQTLLYLGLNQAEISRKVYMPKAATETLSTITGNNKGVHTTYPYFNLATDMLSETRLMEKRSAVEVPKKNKTKTVTAAGTYQFDSIPGYAMPGMVAKASPGLRLAETLTSPLKRETLLKEDKGYTLSFTVPKGTKNGNYTITVSRPDFSHIAQWQGYASDPDLEKSYQWCATIEDTLPMKDEQFTVTVAMETKTDPTTEKPKESSSQAASSQQPQASSSDAASSQQPQASSSDAASSQQPQASSSDAASSQQPQVSSSDAASSKDSHSSASASSSTTTNSAGTSSPSAMSTSSSDRSSGTLAPVANNSLKSEEPPEESSNTPHQQTPLGAYSLAAGKEESPQTASGKGQNQSSASGRLFTLPPITGDNLRVFLWATVAIVAGIGLIVMEVIRRREEQKNGDA